MFGLPIVDGKGLDTRCPVQSAPMTGVGTPESERGVRYHPPVYKRFLNRTQVSERDRVCGSQVGGVVRDVLRHRRGLKGSSTEPVTRVYTNHREVRLDPVHLFQIDFP